MIEIMTQMVKNDCSKELNIHCKIVSRAQHSKRWKLINILYA